MAQVKVADRVWETTTGTGAGGLSLAGVATPAAARFSVAVGSGIPTYYAIVHRTTGQWEVGTGFVTAGTPDVLTRSTVLANSAGTLVPLVFSAGTKDVFVDLPAEKAVALDYDLPQLTLGSVGVPLLRADADAAFGQVGATVINQTYVPVSGSVNHMSALAVNAIVDGNFGALAPNWTVGQQIAGRFYSRSVATRTADVFRIVAVSGQASHSGTTTASFVHAYDAFASALGGAVTNLTCYDTNQSVGASTVGTARLTWLTPPSFFNGGTAGATVAIEIDNWPGSNSNFGITPWTAGAWGSAYAIRAAPGHVALMGPLSVGTQTLPPINQLAQFITTTGQVGPMVMMDYTQTTVDPTQAWSTTSTPGLYPSGALVVNTLYNPTANGAANSMQSFFAHLYIDGSFNTGTLCAVKGAVESYAAATRSGTTLRMVGGQFSGIKRDTSAGLVTFVEGVFATASVLGGSVTNASAYNLSGSVTGTAAVGTWRAIWVALPFVANTATVTTTVGLDLSDFSSLSGTQYGTVYAIRVAGGLSYLADLRVKGNIGFYDTAPIAKQTVGSGLSRSTQTAAVLADMLTKVAALGLWTDGTVA